MLKHSALLSPAFFGATASLLSAAAVTPAAILSINPLNTHEVNNRRKFNPNEESGLDYNVDNFINPFALTNANYTVYNLDNNFYTKQYHPNHTKYHALDWSDLDAKATSGLECWLPQICNYLLDDQNQYPIQVKAKAFAVPSTHMSEAIQDAYNFDFSSAQASHLNLSWSTNQFGIISQNFEDSWVQLKENAHCCFPEIYSNNPGSPTKQVVWKSLTGSDFYTNYNSSQDPSPIHIPHKFNFKLKANIYTDTNYETRPGEKSELPRVSGLKYLIDFISEHEQTSQIKQTNDVKTKDLNKLSDFIYLTSMPTSSYNDYLRIPSEFTNFRWFAFNSDKTRSPSMKQDMMDILVGPKTTSNDDIEPLVDQHGFKEDRATFWDQLDMSAFTPLFNSESFPGYTNYNFFYEKLKSNQQQPTSSASTQPTQIQLPDPQNQTYPTSITSSYLNFIDYYDLDNQGGLSCDIDIDQHNNLTYTFKSGNNIVNVITATISNSFKDFLNMCLSAQKSTSTNIPIETVKSEYATRRNDLKNDTYCTVESSGNNNIINFHTTVGDNGTLVKQAPFVQSVDNIDFANSLVAQSTGIGMSVSSPETSPINAVDSDPFKSYYLQNFAFLSNQTHLNAKADGNNNRLQSNLDYLLAINPTTTNFAVQGDEIPSVQVQINPYYLQAAANAYSAYNFWLDFYLTHIGDWGSIAADTSVSQAAFKELIMRGFIKTKDQAEAIFKNLKGRQITALIPGDWVETYLSAKQPVFLTSYAKIGDNWEYEPCDDFNWKTTSFTPAVEGIWVGPDPSVPVGKRPTIKASSWAPFCWNYGISPQTFSFLKSIPLDYEIVIPYATIDANDKWNSGSVSAATVKQSKSIKWSELLSGQSLKFDYPTTTEDPNWTNKSLVIGCNNSNIPTEQGIHGVQPRASTNPKVAYNDEGKRIELNMPNFSNIKLATITSGFNHINGSLVDDYDLNPIQEYASKEKRNGYIKSSSDINYLPIDNTHSVLAVHKDNAKLNINVDKTFSNNTYIVTKVNGNKYKYDPTIMNYFQISDDGALGVMAEFSKWRNSIASITTESGKRYYHSVNASISGYKERAGEEEWLMQGVAPEDWFGSNYEVEFNGYKTYSWAFHPSGLWCYNMQFKQDESEIAFDEWDKYHQSYGLDYCLWGRPVITPITRKTYIPSFLLEDKIDPTTGKIIEKGWKTRWYETHPTSTKAPVFYTNNETFELAFKVEYPDLKFQSEALGDKYITPIQYVYIPDCNYRFDLTKKSEETTRKITDFKKTDSQYGDFTPSSFDAWNIDVSTSEESEQKFSTHNIKNLLSPNELINFYGAAADVSFYKANIKYDDFMTLYKNGWIYINPVKLSNEDHLVCFEVWYDKNILIDDNFEKLSKVNPNYKMIEVGNKKAKIPNIDPSTSDWISTSQLTITDFRCIGTEWSTVKSSNKLAPLTIGLIVCCSVVPLLIVGLGIGLKRTRTKYKRIK